MSMRLSSRSIRASLNQNLSKQRFSLTDLNGGSPQISRTLLEAACEKEEEMNLKRRQEAPFQQIDFLVRDWQNFNDETNLKECLKEVDEYKEKFFSDRTAEDLKETRKQIKDCYQNIGVFMLPNPGKEVTKKTFDGSLLNVDPNFLTLLGFYIEHVLGYCLMPKLINKEVLYAEDFEAYSFGFFFYL